MHIGDEVDENRNLNAKMNECSMTFQNNSALRALGGDVKKNVHLQRGKIRSHGKKHFSIIIIYIVLNFIIIYNFICHLLFVHDEFE